MRRLALDVDMPNTLPPRIVYICIAISYLIFSIMKKLFALVFRNNVQEVDDELVEPLEMLLPLDNDMLKAPLPDVVFGLQLSHMYNNKICRFGFLEESLISW